MMEQAKAVIMVSHSLTFIEQMCTRVIWMKHGQVQFDGEPKDAVAAYREDIKEKKKKIVKQH